ncbi:MAG: hypothetical protein H6Q73_896 [Firmicutes bacterium]|nr:hypothetical protein [Bacillota bacterium]
MYNDKAIEKVVAYITDTDCPSHMGLKDRDDCSYDGCLKCWKWALNSEPEDEK